MTANLYDRDFYAWANEPAALLRAGRVNAVDIEHSAEEIESMGRTEKRELVSRLTVLAPGSSSESRTAISGRNK